MNPHDLFKSIKFSCADTGPMHHQFKYIMTATTHTGAEHSCSVFLSKSLQYNVDEIEYMLTAELIEQVISQVKAEAHDAWMEHLYEIKKKDEEYKKLQMMNPIHSGVLGQFGIETIPTQEYKTLNFHTQADAHTVIGIDPAENGKSGLSIFDVKKKPKFVQSEAQKLFTNEMIDALVEMTLEKIDAHNHPSTTSDMMSIALKTFPGLGTRMKKCPHIFESGKHCARANNNTLADTIIHLNDYHKYPREKIADWLDTLDIDLSVPIKREQVNAEGS